MMNLMMIGFFFGIVLVFSRLVGLFEIKIKIIQFLDVNDKIIDFFLDTYLEEYS